MVRRTTTRTARQRRHRRVRTRVRGTVDRPRLVVFRSAQHIVVQVIDDALGRTLCSSSDRGVAPESGVAQRRVAIAKAVGNAIASAAAAQGIKRVVFDRGGYAYHGQVQAVADGAREGGLEF